MKSLLELVALSAARTSGTVSDCDDATTLDVLFRAGEHGGIDVAGACDGMFLDGSDTPEVRP